jgi:TRAP-type C4-dicarboxylate transport system permease large subunit
VLKDLYVPSADATDVNGVDSMYVHLSDATAATAATTGNATFLEVVGRGRSVSNAAARGRGFVGALLPPSATRRALSAGDAGVP